MVPIPPMEVCQAPGIKLSLLLARRKRRVERAPKLFERESDRDPVQAQIAELERLVGHLTLEINGALRTPPIHSLERESA